MMNNLLGPFGAATVVLFTSQFDTQLPKLSEVKKRLSITDGKYYSRNGNFMYPITQLEDALATARQGGNSVNVSIRSVNCSHILITVAGVHSDLFALIKYSAELMEGFNLTDSAMTELQELLERRRRISRMRNACSDWAETLTDQIVKAQGMGLTDPSILEVDLSAISSITDPYALGALAEADLEITRWYERYRWRTVQEARALAESPHEQEETGSAHADATEKEAIA